MCCDRIDTLLFNRKAFLFTELVDFLYHSAISDTCMAMGEWVENPRAETALSNILPCVDQRTTNQTLFKSKQVINDIVNIVNQYIDSAANANPPPQAVPYYFNQSGPAIPHLCYPYDSQLQDRQCTAEEVTMANASLVCSLTSYLMTSWKTSNISS